MDGNALDALQRILGGARPEDVESTTLECKDLPSDEKPAMQILADAAICFANGSGGTIVVGLDDDAAGRAALRGCALDPAKVQRRIYELSRPPLLVAVERVRFEGIDLLAIRVPESVEIHADPQGRARRRVGTDCVPLSPQDQVLLQEERRGIDWSALPASSGVSDVSPAALDAARRTLARIDDERRPLAALGDRDLCRALGVVDPKGRLLNAGAVLLFTLCRERSVDAETIAPILQKSPAEAESVLQRLARDAGILESTRATRRMRRSSYRFTAETLRALGSAVRYHRRTFDEIDRKVIAHVREYGRVTNRTLQNLFDVDVYRARDILGDLVERDILVKTSRHARGPGVEYGPGPSFQPLRRGRRKASG